MPATTRQDGRRPLGRKTASTDQGRWLTLLAEASTVLPHGHLDRLVTRTVGEIRQVCRGRHVAFAWSGSKNTLVLAALMRLAGYSEGLCVLTGLEYPAFLQWLPTAQPPQLTLLHTRHDLAWLAAHPHMLFPRTTLGMDAWFQQVRQWGYRRYSQREGVEILAVGRRKLDGQYCGVAGGYQTRQGLRYYAPLANWSHEETFAALAAFECTLPPCYFWPRGFQLETGPWPARRCTGSLRYAWDELWLIDRQIVLDAARVLPAAGAYLAVRDSEALYTQEVVC